MNQSTQFLLAIAAAVILIPLASTGDHFSNSLMHDDFSPNTKLLPLTNGSSHPSDLVSICQAFAIEFADAAANYTRCFIVNARPLHLCLKCVDDYLVLNRAYADLEKMTDKVFRSGVVRVKECNSWVLNADRVMAIQQTKAFFEDLWSVSQCTNCFSNYTWKNKMTSKTAQHVITFNELYNDTQNCFANYTVGDRISVEMSDLSNVTIPGQSKACNVCLPAYDKLNTYYSSLHTQYGDSLCMDIVDSMNYTRLVWGGEFNCTGNTRQDGITITISALFTMSPLVFYIGSHIHYQRLENRIIQQNRLLRSRHNSERGSMLDHNDGIQEDTRESSESGASTSAAI